MSAFEADVRNCGGRSQIASLMSKHRSRMLSIKSVLNIKAPHPHVKRRSLVDARGEPKGYEVAAAVSTRMQFCRNVEGYTKSPEFAQVRATYRTIAGLKKGSIDSTAPKTFALIRVLSANKKENNYRVVEHMRNLDSLQRRMGRIEHGNVTVDVSTY